MKGWRSGAEQEDIQSGGYTVGRLTPHRTMGQSGLGMDHKWFHPTMFTSFLDVKGGNSISETEVAGIASSGGKKPLLSIRLEDRREDFKHGLMQFMKHVHW